MIEIPGYQIKREIGQGGMASVHLAVQTSLERQVALKVMSPALAADPTFTRRFLQEARTLASLAHANIVQVFDVGVTPNQLHYFSMQYLPGGDFVARVQRGLDEGELKRVLSGVAKALAYAHERGYVHRDVAPGNILFDSADNPVLTDFGIALAASQATRITSTGFSVGTSHYMSPEQARGGDIDTRSDLYSLGVLTWFGLTGKPPFDGADGFAVAYAHVFEAIPRLPSAQSHWQELIDRCLAKDPKDRYANAEQLLGALEAIPVAQRAKNGDGAARTPELAAATVVVKSTAVATARPEAAKPAPAKPAPAARSAPAKPATRASAAESRRSGGIWLALAGVGVVGAAALGGYLWFASRQPPATVAAVAPAPVATVAPVATPPSPTPPPAPPPTVDSAPPPPRETPAETTVATPVVEPVVDPLASTTDLAPPNGNGSEALQVAPAGPTPLLLDDGSPGNLADVPTVDDPVQKLVRLGRSDLAAQRLTTPPNQNALDRFKLALRIDARDKGAKQGIVDTAKAYVTLGNKAQSLSDWAGMKLNFDKALELAALVPAEGKVVADEVRQRRTNLVGPLLEDARNAVAAWDKVAAKAAYDKALLVDPSNAVAQEGLRKLPSVGSAGFVFRDKFDDGGQGPDLVVLPGGRVAAGRFEVSRGEFRRYWSAGGSAAAKELSCRDRESVFRSSKKRSWQNPDIEQDDSHPVVCLSFDQAQAYVRWLSQRSGKTYRLLTSAEFDSLAREAKASCGGANLADQAFNKAFDSRAGASCDDGFAGSAPVGRFSASRSGVYDIDGNVREWVAERRARGRSWLSPPDKENVDASESIGADVGLNSLGLRVAREIDQKP
ncbi:MAG: protein kinase [Rhodanobacteraceae bacterium]|nr:protein kinase [Rhodanobacteraceae bacterium]